MGYKTSVPLPTLPEGVRFLDKDKISYDPDKGLLTYNGYMSDGEKNGLLLLSQDSTYKESINKLFTDSRKVNDWSDIPKLPEEAQTKAVSDIIRKEALGLSISEEDLLKKLVPAPITIPAEEFLKEQLSKGLKPVISVTGAGTKEVHYVPISEKKNPRIMLVETYALTSFLGDYGVGKTIRTFTLLPNEKTKISIKTWKSTETTTKQASSVLDSWSRDTSDTFEKSVQSEISNRDELTETFQWNVDSKVKGHFDIGIFGVEGERSEGARGSTNRARESLAKNVSNATEKHVANASSKRNVEVNTSFEAKMVTGEEQLIVRELENVNAGRVLNFVFRQLNQEYITYLHLIDVRLAFADGFGGGTEHYKEYPLSQLEEFLNYYIRDKKESETVNPKDEVRRKIVEELASISDYRGTLHSFVEAVDFSTEGRTTIHDAEDYLVPSKRLDAQGKPKLYLRVKGKKWDESKNKWVSQFYLDNDPDVKHDVDGIILSKNTYILPTDSVIVEALLGQAEALDIYSQDSRQAVIDMKRVEIEKMRMAKKIVESKDDEKANIFVKVYPVKEEKKTETP